MSNSPDVYRPRRRGWRWLWRFLLVLVLALILIALMLIYSGHKFIVYDKEGLRVLFPMFGTYTTAEDAAGPTPTVYPAELVYEEPDYSTLLSTAGQNLDALRGKYLSSDSITPESIKAAAEQIAAAKGNALVLQMKPSSGRLSWKSGVVMADSFEVNGSLDLAETLRDLKAEHSNIRLVAVVCCCVDSLMADRYTALALKTTDGSSYTDGNGGWVDPYSTQLRDYLASLCRELADLGFDEIALSYLQMPVTSAELDYSAQLSTQPTPTDAVMSLARYLRGALSDRRVELDIILSSDSALQGLASQSGQDLKLLPKVFGRLCVYGEGDTLTTVREAIVAGTEDFDADKRFVPFVHNAQLEGSWVMTG